VVGGYSFSKRNSKLAPIASCETIEGYSSDTDQSTETKNEEEEEEDEAEAEAEEKEKAANNNDAGGDNQRQQQSTAIKSDEANEKKNAATLTVTSTDLKHGSFSSTSMPIIKETIEKADNKSADSSVTTSSLIKLKLNYTETVTVVAPSLNESSTKLMQLGIKSHSVKEHSTTTIEKQSKEDYSLKQKELKFKDLAKELESGKEMDSSNSSLSLSESISSASSLTVRGVLASTSYIISCCLFLFLSPLSVGAGKTAMERLEREGGQN
jgi:hypothetical protein